MKPLFFSINKLISVFFLLLPLKLFAIEVNPKTDFFIEGKGITPWELSLQFSNVKLENNTGKTLRGSLAAKPTSKNVDDDAIRLTWKPKGIKNQWGTEDKNILTATLTNTAWHTDLSQFKENGVLLLDVKVIKAPKKLVELSMECGWNWKCRSSVPLKLVLRSLPKDEWVSLPIPLKCFDKGNFDLSKVTSSFMLYTGGKMTLEIGSIKVVNAPELKSGCYLSK